MISRVQFGHGPRTAAIASGRRSMVPQTGQLNWITSAIGSLECPDPCQKNFPVSIFRTA